MKSRYLFCFIPLLMISCAKDKTTQNNKTIQPIALTADQKALVQTNNQFAFTLFNKAGNQETKENLFISPLSISMALSMTLNGAAGTTKTGMTNALGFGGQQLSVINNYNKLLAGQLQSVDEQVTFNIANSIWYRNTFSVLPAFISTNQNYYTAEVSALDFNSPAAVNTINNWVSAKTNNAIPTIIDQISPDNVMFLINALYFKGSWTNSFDPSKTSDKDFYKEDHSVVTCKMMLQENTDLYYVNDTLSLVELPYGQGNFVMTVMLPGAGKSTSDLIAAFNAGNWKRWNDAKVSGKVQIELPRFKMSYATSDRGLIDLLSSMGMTDAFDQFNANFKGINANGGLYISSIKHKTMIDVNEEGTVAAAVTSVGIAITTISLPPQIIYIDVNKPFLFVISEKSTGAILFTGRIMDPTK